MTLDIERKPEPLECTFTGKAVPFTYSAGADTIVFDQATGVTSTKCGTAKLDGTFTIEIGSTAVSLD